MPGPGNQDERGTYRAFLWLSGRMVDLGTLGGKTSDAVAINDGGQVVGYADTKGGRGHAFLWQNGTMRDLGVLGSDESTAVGINGKGPIVGSYEANSEPRAFLWQKGQMRNLRTPADGQSAASAINEDGRVVGWSSGRGGARSVRASVWENRRLTRLGVLGGGEYAGSNAMAINNRCHVLGNSSSDTLVEVAFLWPNGKMTELEGAVALNDRGQVVGGKEHAFVWQHGVATDLGTLLGGTKSEAVAINEHNQIVGYSTTKTGKQHAVLWTLEAR